MQIRYGYEIVVEVTAPTAFVALLDLHPDEHAHILEEAPLAVMTANGPLPHGAITLAQDRMGNVLRRFTLPAGISTLRSMGFVQNSGEPDVQNFDARATAPADLSASVLPFMAGSRYCETDRLGPLAWQLFGHLQPGWPMVQAIVDHVHARIRFDYQQARASRTALEANDEQVGVCRDYAHLSIAFCRAMNLPARYCTGYLGDIGVPADPNPMDFSAWFEVYLNGKWYAFDARHNRPRIGRLLMARGLDASDTAILTSFGPHLLRQFTIFTDEVQADAPMKGVVAPMNGVFAQALPPPMPPLHAVA